MCGGNQGFDYFGVFGQSVQCGLDALHLAVDGCFLQHTQVGIKAVIGHVDVTVLLADQFQNAFFRAGQFLFQDRRPCRILQVFAAAVGEFHQVLVILIASSGQHGV